MGYYNPAITLGRVLSGQLPIILSIGYFVAQILGGIAGAAIFRVGKFTLLQRTNELLYSFLLFIPCVVCMSHSISVYVKELKHLYYKRWVVK